MFASSLEPIPSWDEKRLGVKVTHTILAPDVVLDASPLPKATEPDSLTRSSSSEGDNSRSSLELFSPGFLSPLVTPRPLPHFHSQRLLACGGPGFSMAVIDCETGTSDQLLVPFPHMPQEQFELLPDDLVEFTFHDISTMTLIGERQLWAGTSSGTLHIFELTSSPSCSSSVRLKEHTLIKINEPILSMACRPSEYVFRSDSPLANFGPQTEVLLGVPYGYIIIFAGAVDQQGRLQDVSKLPRKVVRLTNSSIDCAVNSIVHTTDGTSETYWCSCGSKIVVLQRRTWQKLQEIDTGAGFPSSSPLHPEVERLHSSDYGVWSSTANSSTVTLWDTTTPHTAKLHITVSEHQTALSVTALHCFQSLLMVGTERGDLIVFKIDKSNLSSQNHHRKVNGKRGFSYVASYHCGHLSILSIYTNTPHQSPILFTQESCIDEPSLVHILVVLGSSSEEESGCLLKAFELVISSSPSPCNTPSLSSSLISNSSSLRGVTPRRLSIVQVADSSHNYLPLAS